MVNSKTTKRALLTSALAILACVAMLIGTTFAWFTDTASTGVNKIVSGKLDIELQYATAWNAVTGAPIAWDKAEGKVLNFRTADNRTDNILWEPGATYQLPELRIVNNGNLALKYKIAIAGAKDANPNNGVNDLMLLDVIDWTYSVEGAGGAAVAVLGTERHLNAKTADSDVFDTLTIKGQMQTTAGNDYQGLSIDGIAITVVATQDTVEYDSYGNQYDKDAEYPVYAAAPIEKDEDGNLAGDVTLKTPEKHEATGNPVATATVPASAKLDADANQLELIIEKSATPANFTVNITQNEPKTLDISMKGLAADNEQPIKVEFYIETGLSFVEIDHNGTAMSRCSAMKWLDADQEFYYDSTTGLVTMLTKTFSPFTYTSDKFQWDDRKADSYQTPVDTDNKVITVNSAEELALFKYEITDKKVNYSGYTLNITSDIDLGAGFWRPINPINNLTINGNGHIISNLLVRSCTNSSGYGFGFIGNAMGKVTIRDLTFDKADVAARKYGSYYGNVGAVVLAYAYGTTEFDNVQVINSSLNGYGKIGMLLGMGADPGVKVTFKDCVSRDNTIRAVYNIGGLAGNIQRGNGVDNATVENCTVQNINVIYDTNEHYIDLNNVTATLKSNDKPDGTDEAKMISGRMWINSGYYWGGYADYYVSYGNSSYDAPIEGYTAKLANSEYLVNQ